MMAFSTSIYILMLLSGTSNTLKVTYLTKYGKPVVRKKSIGLIHEEISSNELLEAPVFALHEPVCPLTLCTVQ